MAVEVVGAERQVQPGGGNNRRGTGRQGGIDVVVSVAVHALDGEEEGAVPRFPRIAGDRADLRIGRSVEDDGAGLLYDVFQFHFNTMLTVSPLTFLAPGSGDWVRTCPTPVYLHFKPAFSIS